MRLLQPSSNTARMEAAAMLDEIQPHLPPRITPMPAEVRDSVAVRFGINGMSCRQA